VNIFLTSVLILGFCIAIVGFGAHLNEMHHERIDRFTTWKQLTRVQLIYTVMTFGGIVIMLLSIFGLAALKG